MILTEWNTEDAIAFARKEEREEIARNALTKGFSTEDVHEITGLDFETIQELSANN